MLPQQPQDTVSGSEHTGSGWILKYTCAEPSVVLGFLVLDSL